MLRPRWPHCCAGGFEAFACAADNAERWRSARYGEAGDNEWTAAGQPLSPFDFPTGPLSNCWPGPLPWGYEVFRTRCMAMSTDCVESVVLSRLRSTGERLVCLGRFVAADGDYGSEREPSHAYSIRCTRGAGL